MFFVNPLSKHCGHRDFEDLEPNETYKCKYKFTRDGENDAPAKNWQVNQPYKSSEAEDSLEGPHVLFVRSNVGDPEVMLTAQKSSSDLSNALHFIN